MNRTLVAAVLLLHCAVGLAQDKKSKPGAVSFVEEMAALKKALRSYRLEVEAALKRRPDNWMAAARAVFIHQVFNERGARDKALRRLYALRKRSKVPSDHYLRDQFVVKNQMIQVREYFELKGERAKKYVFVIMQPDRKITSNLSLGSYATTNAIIRELEKRTKPLFHLDGYFNNGKLHKTYGFYDDEPSYDTVKRDAIRALKDEMPPVSGSDGKRVKIAP
jgi:hypothetical protein